MRIVLLVSALSMVWSQASALSERIDIGILQPVKPKSVQIIVTEGQYEILADGKVVRNLAPGDRATFQLQGSLVKVSNAAGQLALSARISLRSTASDSFFRLYVLSPNRVERVYDDDLLIHASSGVLKLINRVDLEKYVAGVVEAETGKQKPLEFYKVQAIVSRTYALNNKRRYLKEGFNLNDQVSCQVYHGKCRWEPEILSAVLITTGKVLVDSDMKLITAAFHSNSGGETVASNAVWTGNLAYLSPKLDEYSSFGDHANWSAKLHKQAWLDYLQKKYSLNTADKLVAGMALHYEQPNRQIYFLDPAWKIPLKDIRKDWNFNSTFFNIYPLGSDSLKVEGRGFGHGTGLSQEGAMRMADIGFPYYDIVHFYYKDVHIIDLDAVDFYRGE